MIRLTLGLLISCLHKNHPKNILIKFISLPDCRLFLVYCFGFLFSPFTFVSCFFAMHCLLKFYLSLALQFAQNTSIFISYYRCVSFSLSIFPVLVHFSYLFISLGVAFPHIIFGTRVLPTVLGMKLLF